MGRAIAASLLLAMGMLASSEVTTPTPAAEAALAWPEIRPEQRPWTRWWWLGSAVDEAGLRRHLELFRAAGIGGVEISPIYGVEGEEARQVPYLGSRWLDLFRFTAREARRLGLGVDMIQGTGWPFGGPWVRREDVSARAVVAEIPLDGAGRPVQPLPANGTLLALVATSPAGEWVDLTERVRPDGTVEGAAPAGSWSLHALWLRPTGQQVKRAAPGGEGPVIDHFSREAMVCYLAHFDAALARLPPSERPRAVFNDSFEAFGANWTRALFAEFARRRGYDLRGHLAALIDRGDAERGARVRSDYRQTISELLLEHFTRPWTEWAHRYGMKTRNQAHGSPGNVLDLYAATDIPETEMFGPGRRTNGSRLADGDEPPPPADWSDILVCKLASSAAHVAGKPLCSSESFTWLREHFHETLAAMKGQADSLFVAGVNHLFFHGTPYTGVALPAEGQRLLSEESGWPGWLFYASTHVGPTNTWWEHLPSLCAYLARCQSFLQSGRPDNDLLVYFPIYDLWAKDDGATGLLQYVRVHNTDTWLERNLAPFAATVRHLWQRGYGFDLVSDDLLRERVTVRDGHLHAGGGRYRALALAGCTLLPSETLERILALAGAGATVLVVGELPNDVPGLGAYPARLRRLRERLASLPTPRSVGDGVREIPVGSGRLMLATEPAALLERAGIPREAITDHGVEFIRREDAFGKVYFLANRGHRSLDGWFPLATAARAAVRFDPLTGRRGRIPVRRTPRGVEIALTLAPGESCVVRALWEPLRRGPRWPEYQPAGEAVTIAGEWHVEFVAGGPTLPRSRTIRDLTSWTAWGDDLRAFSGTARYRTTFRRPATEAAAWALDLGRVRESARVFLNGRELGVRFAPPYRLEFTAGLRDGPNELVIEVANLMANRIADMDRRRVPWRKFYFVNLHYRPFDASSWEPLPSGLLGPVRLIPLRRR